MPAKSAFSIVGLAHKVCLSAENQGYIPELINALAEHPTLFRDMLQVQRGLAEIVPKQHVINCDTDPFVPPDWQGIKEHRRSGFFKWNPATVQLYLSNCQRGSKMIGGCDLRKELAGKPVLNANVLDYLLAHPHLIPEEWKDKWVFFWGTIYYIPSGSLCVRCLFWYGGGWGWDCRGVGDGWCGDFPAALGASI